MLPKTQSFRYRLWNRRGRMRSFFLSERPVEVPVYCNYVPVCGVAPLAVVLLKCVLAPSTALTNEIICFPVRAKPFLGFLATLSVFPFPPLLPLRWHFPHAITLIRTTLTLLTLAHSRFNYLLCLGSMRDWWKQGR